MTNGLSLEELMKEGTYPEEYTEGENWKILHGDTLKLVKAFQPGIFDAVITEIILPSLIQRTGIIKKCAFAV